MAQDTKIRITAETQEAERALKSFGGSLSALKSNLASFAGVLGGALSVGALANFIKRSIELQDELGGLSKQTGIAASDLAGLKFAAEQNGASLESVARGVRELAVNMAATPDKFAKLGINATTATGALTQVADIVAQLPDGMQKTALLAELMGNKVGPEMAEFLSQGGAAIKEYIAKGKNIYRTSDENVAKAKEFNDRVAELSARMNGLGVSLAENVLPALLEVVGSFNQMVQSGSDFLPVGRAIRTVLETLIVLGANVGYVFRQTGIEIGGMAAQLVALAKLDFKGFRFIGEQMKADAAKAREEIDAFSERILNPQKETNISTPAPANQSNRPDIAAFLAGNKAGKKAGQKDAFSSAISSLQEDAFRKQMALLGVAAEQVKVYELAKRGATAAQIEAAQAAADEVMAIDAIAASEKARAQAVEAANRIIFDIDPIAKASAEWEKLVALKEQGLLTDEQIGQAYAKTFGEIDNSGKEAFASLEAAVRGWGNAFTDTLTDMVLTGKGSFKDLANSIIRDLVRIQIQKSITDKLLGLGSSLFGSLVPNADGGVYAGAGISAYSGSVVSKPTLFPFARGIGLMGEAGPEAILPLTRINGKLGVQAVGATAAPNVVVQVINQSGQPVNAKQQGAPQFNGRDYVLGIVLEAANTDPGFRSAMGIGGR